MASKLLDAGETESFVEGGESVFGLGSPSFLSPHLLGRLFGCRPEKHNVVEHDQQRDLGLVLCL